MFDIGFPRDWSSLKKLIWLKAINGGGGGAGIWKTVTGTLIHITDALASPMQKCEVTLEPIQDLHGQDAPYPAGGGKNKFDQEYYSDATKYNQNYSGYSYTQPLLLKPNTQYIFKANSTSSVGTAMYFYIRVISGSDPDAMSSSDTGVYPVYNGNLAGSGVGNLFTTDETGAIRFGFPQNTTYLSDLMSVLWQLEEGSTATPYAPYANICPITGWTGCEVNRTGVNVWDEEVELGSLNTVTGEEITSSSIIRAKHFAPVVAGEAYGVATKSGSGNGIWMLFYDANKEVITEGLPSGASRASNARRFDSGYKFIAPTNCAYVRWYFQSGYGTTYLNDTSINYSTDYATADTTYHPYQGTTLSVTFPDTVYGGKYEFVGGSGESKYASIDLGTLTWSKSSAGNNKYRFIADVPNLKIGSNVFGLCSAYKKIATTYGSTEDGWSFHGTVARVLFFIDAFSDYTVDEFKTAMSGVQFVYELAEPITIQLTPQEISTLQGINNVWSNTNADTTIIYKAQAS